MPLRKVGQDCSAGGTHALQTQVKLCDNGIHLAIQMWGSGVQHSVPQTPLLLGGGPGHVQTDRRALPEAEWFATGYYQQSAYVFQEGKGRTGAFRMVEIITVNQQYAVAQNRLTFPQTTQDFALGYGPRDVASPQAIHLHPQCPTGGSRNGVLPLVFTATELDDGPGLWRFY